MQHLLGGDAGIHLALVELHLAQLHVVDVRIRTRGQVDYVVVHAPPAVVGVGEQEDALRSGFHPHIPGDGRTTVVREGHRVLSGTQIFSRLVVLRVRVDPEGDQFALVLDGARHLDVLLAVVRAFHRLVEQIDHAVGAQREVEVDAGVHRIHDAVLGLVELGHLQGGVLLIVELDAGIHLTLVEFHRGIVHEF